MPPASMRPQTIPPGSMRVPPTGTASLRPPAAPSVRPPAPGAPGLALPDEASPADAVRAIPTATHTVLEANVDDASGELAASWIEAILAAGALDVWVTPIIMKKGRPAMTVSALTVAERADAVAHTLLRETTSLGLRRYDVTRLERPRTIEYAETPFGRIPVKVATGPFGPPQVKPEFDACAVAARAHGVPVREVLRAATAAANARVGER